MATIDMTNESWAGPSASDRMLYAHLTEHIEKERGLLEEYSDIAAQTESKAFRYVVNLLIEDEIRHHRLFSELAESVEAIALMKRQEPPVPFIDRARTEREVVLQATERLLEHETEDARELQGLRREIRDAKDDSLNGLLVEIMQLDTQKHIAMLRFVRDRAKRRNR